METLQGDTKFTIGQKLSCNPDSDIILKILIKARITKNYKQIIPLIVYSF